VWGLTKTDQEWSAALEAALTATRRDDLEHGTNAAYVAGCVCRDCREHQRVRMGQEPWLVQLILAGGGNGEPLDYTELERRTRVGFERG
jgi:hypothetical protein